MGIALHPSMIGFPHKPSRSRHNEGSLTMSRITRGLTAIAISVVAVSSAVAQNKIIIGTVGGGNTLEWPLYIAEKKGYLEQQKLALISQDLG